MRLIAKQGYPTIPFMPLPSCTIARPNLIVSNSKVLHGSTGDGAGFGIEMAQALDAAHAQDITQAQHPTGRLSAVPAELLDGLPPFLLALGWCGSIKSISACHGTTTSISERNFSRLACLLAVVISYPRSRAVCRPSTQSWPAITEPLSREWPGSSRDSLIISDYNINEVRSFRSKWNWDQCPRRLSLELG